uniref:Uncharacterized protein n=1 Tax=Scleropages formosus TaxID=113540 RepID=A0A8C9SPM7_SCLFO
VHLYHLLRRKMYNLYSCPEAHVGDGEEVVVADVVAAWLCRVAVEVLLLVAPHLLGRHHEHHEAEEEDDGEPHAAECRGVFVDSAEEPLEERPVHPDRAALTTAPGTGEPGVGGGILS